MHTRVEPHRLRTKNRTEKAVQSLAPDFRNMLESQHLRIQKAQPPQTGINTEKTTPKLNSVKHLKSKNKEKISKAERMKSCLMDTEGGGFSAISAGETGRTQNELPPLPHATHRLFNCPPEENQQSFCRKLEGNIHVILV